jgi:hypothetical protein
MVTELSDSSSLGDYTRTKYPLATYIDVSYHGDQTVDNCIVVNCKSDADARNLRRYIPNTWKFTLAPENTTVVTATSVVDNGDNTFTVNIDPLMGGTVVVHDGNNPTDTQTAQHWEIGWQLQTKLYHHVTELNSNPGSGMNDGMIVFDTMSPIADKYTTKTLAQYLYNSGLDNGSSAYIPLWSPVFNSSYTQVGRVKGLFSSDGSNVYVWYTPFSGTAAAYQASVSRDFIV